MGFSTLNGTGLKIAGLNIFSSSKFSSNFDEATFYGKAFKHLKSQ
jgi:hypothetical protein